MRLLLGVTIAGVVNVVIISLSGWVSISAVPTWLLAFQYALLAPLLALLLATFAQNKVEGLAHFKVYSFVANLPILMYFLGGSAWHVLAVVPTYWSFRSVEAAYTGDKFYFLVGGGALVYLLALGGLIRIFERRVF